MKTIYHFAALLLAGTALNAQSSFSYLDINRVKTRISAGGIIHNDSTLAYEVPKGSGLQTGSGTIMWLSGIDGGGQLRQAAQVPGQTGTSFWPGPLSTIDASPTQSATTTYNRVWKVTYNDINNFVTNHIPTNDILTWPGNGDLSLNEDPRLAPYIDVNSDGHYDTNDGDYPDIKGDQAIYTIFNDNGGPHSAQQGLALGMEVHLMAYAFGCPYVIAGHNELAYTTFYNYKIINRSVHTLNQTGLTLFSDLNVGNPGDDYLGCDIGRNLAFVYNGDNFDEQVVGHSGYANYPPAQGIMLLKGPLADKGNGLDDDRDGCVDCTFSVTPAGTITISENTLSEHITMSQLGYFMPGTAGPTTAPLNAAQFFGYQTGYWNDGSRWTCGANAYGGATPTEFVFPDNTYSNGPCGSGWTEVSAANVSGDRNVILSSNGFTLRPGAVIDLEYAFITSFDSASPNNAVASVQKLKGDADKVKAFYSMPFKPTCYQGTAMGVKDNEMPLSVSVYPNPARDLLMIHMPESNNASVTYEVRDVLGKAMISGTCAHADQFPIDISALSCSVYFIRLTLNGHSTVKKFVKN